MSQIVRGLRWIDRLLLKAQNIILIFSTATIIVLMAIGVIMRYIFNGNFNGLEELILILGFWIYFFGGAVAYRDADHMEASMLHPLLKTEKRQAAYRIFKFAVELPIVVVVAKWSYEFIVWSLAYLPSTVVYNIPYVVAQMPIFLCYGLAVFYTAANLVKAIAAFRRCCVNGIGEVNNT